MHISCPRCDKTINAKNYNLFQVWECPDCEWQFRGIHADQPVFLNYIFEFIAPLYHGDHINDLADCPLCGATIKLRWIWSTSPGRSFGPFRRKGYNGPYVCHACRNPLPWDYPSQKPHVKEAHDKWVDDYNRQNGFITEEKEKKPQENPKENKKEELQQLEKQMQKRKEKEKMSELANKWKEEKEESLKTKPFCKQKPAEW